MDGWDGWMDLRVGGGIEHLTVLISRPIPDIYYISHINLYNTRAQFAGETANRALKSEGPNLPGLRLGARFAGAQFAGAQFAWNPSTSKNMNFSNRTLQQQHFQPDAISSRQEN